MRGSAWAIDHRRHTPIPAPHQKWTSQSSVHSGQPALPTLEGSSEAKRRSSSAPTGLSRVGRRRARCTGQPNAPGAQRGQPAPGPAYSKFGPGVGVQDLQTRVRGRGLRSDAARCRAQLPGMCTSSARPQGPRRWARRCGDCAVAASLVHVTRLPRGPT